MTTTPGVLSLTQEVPTSTPGDTLPNAGTGKLLLFPEAGVWYAKDSSGVVTALAGVLPSRQIIAGAGLTGGGSLAADRTLDVVAANGTIVVNADSIQVGSITASLVSDFDAQVHTSRLDQMAAPTGPVSFGSQKATSLANGTVSTDGVNLGQLTAAVEGRKNKDPALWATTAAITLSGLGTQGGGEWTGSLTAGDRILVKNQASSPTNGIYAASAGAWTRVSDADTGTEITLASVLILNGATLIGDTWTQTATVTTIGTDAQTWVQTGEGATITADGSTLQLVGTTLSEKDGGTTNAKLADMVQATIKLRAAGAGTGPPIDGTPAQLKTILTYLGTEVANTPAGNIAATTVQAAINELDTEKVPTTRLINTTAPVTGGGDLSADRTIGLTTSPAGQTPVGVTRLISTTSPLTGGGDLSGDRTIGIPAGTVVANGYKTIADSQKLGMFYDAVADFGFVGDHVKVFDGACSTGANGKITTAGACNFVTQASNGMRITLAGAGVNGAVYVGTITNVDSTTQVSVSPAISTTVSGKGLQFGTDNTTAIANMVAAVNNSIWPTVHVTFGQAQLQGNPSLSVHETNDFGCPTQFQFNKAVAMYGVGSTTNHDNGDYAKGGGTCLSWWGSSVDGGTAFKAFITFIPTTGTTAQAISCPTLKDIWLDCRNGDQNQALIAVDAQSANGFQYDSVFVMDALAVGYYFRVVGPGLAVPNAGSLGEAKDSTRGTLSNLRARMLDNPATGTGALIGTTTTSAVTLSGTPQALAIAGSPTLPNAGYVWVMCSQGYYVLVNYTSVTGTPVGGTLTSSAITALNGCTVSAQDAINVPATVSGSNVIQCVPGNGTCVLFDGDTTANACCATGITWVFLNGISVANVAQPKPATIVFRNSDSWEIFNPMINHPAASSTNHNTNDGAINRIRSAGITFCGSGTASTLSSRNNHIWGGSPGAGGVQALGLTSAGAILAGPSGPNYYDGQQMGNGEGLPVVENGAVFFSTLHNGALPRGGVGVPVVADQTIGVVAAPGTLITGSVLWLPVNGLQVGTTIEWLMEVVCSTSAVANSFFIRFGSTGTTADTACCTWSPTATAAGALAAVYKFVLTVRTLGAAATLMAHAYGHQMSANGFFGAQAAPVLIATLATINAPATGLTGPAAFSMSFAGGTSASMVFKQVNINVLNPGPR